MLRHACTSAPANKGWETGRSNGGSVIAYNEHSGSSFAAPLLPVLAATIAASKTDDLTFLVTERGTRSVKESFGNWFRDLARPAVLARRTGFARPARAPENGASVHQLMALLGWKAEKMVLIYTARRTATASPPQPRLYSCCRPRRRTKIARTLGPVWEQAKISVKFQMARF